MMDAVQFNRAPVLTLWAVIEAERPGFTRDEALTLGKAVAGLNVYSKGRALGLFQPSPAAVQKYLASNFKNALQSVSEAMSVLEASRDLEELAAQAYSLFEQFRLDIPAGEAGWGAAGVLSLKGIRLLAKRA